MKFLLAGINSKFIHSNPAIHSLKAYAGDIPGAVIETIEFTINQLHEDVLYGIYNEKPDYIGFSCYIWNREYLDFILPEINKILPDSKIFLGGPEVTYHPDRVLSAFPFVSAIMIGEGEETFKELVSSLPENPADFTEALIKNTAGLYLPSGYTKPRDPVSMDEVPFIYDKNFASFTNKIIYYEASRGCPFRCSYCLSSIDKTLRKRNLDTVFTHLDYFLTNKIPQVKFIDRTFNADKAYALSIWNYIKNHDNGITNFHFEIAADLLTPDQINLISTMRPGLIQLEIGVQTTNSQTLAAINRPTDISKIRSSVAALLKNNNVHLHLDLIAGLPFEDFASFINSFNDVFNMAPHELQLGFLKVLPGTDMESHICDYDLKFHDTAPYEILSTKWISYAELRRLKDIEKVLDLYHNSMQFTQTLPALISRFSTPFDFFDSLAAFYRHHDFFVMTPARSRKYEILLSFAASTFGPATAETLRPLLTLDYYLRENPKSKPDFVHTLPDASLIDLSSRNPVTGNFRLRR